MAQHDQVIDNGPGLAVRTDINAAFAAIFSCSSGPVEPAVKVAGQLWFDTSTNPPTTRQRNGANTAWVGLSGLSADGLTLFLKEGSTTRGSLAAAGGADGGTIALRAFNNAGAQTAIAYVSVQELGTDRSVISLYNNNDSALWFRKSTGEIRGGIYNYVGGRTEMRAYDTSGVLQNLMTIDPSRQGWSYTTLWTWNANNITSDVDMRYRVGAARVMRWYYATNGDVTFQESDDNFTSHFINMLFYSRATGDITFANNLWTYGYRLLNVAGNNNGLFPGTGDGAGYNTYNVMLRSWYGIGFTSSLDGICRIFINTRNGDLYSAARLQGNDLVSATVCYVNNGQSWLAQDGDIKFSGGMLGYGPSLGSALSARAGVYTGDNQNETNYPIGYQVLAAVGDNAIYVRNGAYAIGLSSSYAFTVGGSPACAGTWRARGGYDSPGSGAWCYDFQRTA